MKALTLIQPWAWAICHAGKRIENRTWPPPSWLLGKRLALHAGKTYEGAIGVGDPGRHQVPLGAVVAVAVVTGSRRSAPTGEQARWWVGPIGWELCKVEILPSPVFCRGYQRLWNLDPDIEDEVFHQLGKLGESVNA